MHIEDIQDQVELALMRAGEHKIARDYVIYREERAKDRAAKAALSPVISVKQIFRILCLKKISKPGHYGNQCIFNPYSKIHHIMVIMKAKHYLIKAYVCQADIRSCVV